MTEAIKVGKYFSVIKKLKMFTQDDETSPPPPPTSCTWTTTQFDVIIYKFDVHVYLGKCVLRLGLFLSTEREAEKERAREKESRREHEMIHGTR